MPRKTKIQISSIPERIKIIVREMKENGSTINDIWKKLQSCGFDVSRATIGRWSNGNINTIGNKVSYYHFFLTKN
jgi:hypothetical protein